MYIFSIFSKRSLNAFQDRSITNFFRFCMNMFYPKKSILKIHLHLRRENNLQRHLKKEKRINVTEHAITRIRTCVSYPVNRKESTDLQSCFAAYSELTTYSEISKAFSMNTVR